MYRSIFTISRSSLSIKFIGLRSRSNEKNDIFEFTFTSVCLYSTKTYLKGQGHLKVKVTQCQGQIKRNKFSVYCKYFCHLHVMWMVHLWLKGILVSLTILLSILFVQVSSSIWLSIIIWISISTWISIITWASSITGMTVRRISVVALIHFAG